MKSLSKTKQQTISESNWEERFDEKFMEGSTVKPELMLRDGNQYLIKLVKDFIRQEKQKSFEEAVNKIITIIDRQFVSKNKSAKEGVMGLIADCLYDEKKALIKKLQSLLNKHDK